MKTKEILQLDCREKENKIIIQKVLSKIGPLSEYSEEKIPLHVLEKTLRKICTKYNVFPKRMAPDVWANSKHIVWCFVAERIKDKKEIICYGISLYEIMCKAVIACYSLGKGGKN